MISRSILVWSFVLMFCLTGGDGVTAAESVATPAESVRVKPGFKVELLHSSLAGEGSWISMTFDPQGRLILADDVAGLRRMTLNPVTGKVELEKLAGTEVLKHCRGVLYAHDSIYVCATNGEGIYRLQDHDKDGQFEEIKLLCPLVYKSRYGHGANQLRLGPDGMIYIAIGNDVYFPEKRNLNSPYKHHAFDRIPMNPRDDGQDERVGIILKMNPEGTQFTMLAGGLRNQVDLDFNQDGEPFTWDADMEWDVGMPWYRPTRINHIVSAGEYGWRWGTGKWPSWFPDSLPSNLDTGLGSPTGVTFGTNSNWPARHRDSLFAADWQNGRLLQIDMTEQGASYTGSYEVFAEGSPLNICDLEFGPDGALYFITGGRGSQSGLYRITFTGDPNDPIHATSKSPRTPEAAEARELRRKLEQLHVTQDVEQLPFIQSALDNSDHWIRFAAQRALENQPLDSWRKWVANRPDDVARHTALMALARVGEPVDQKIVIKGLRDWDFTNEAELIAGLRTFQLTLARHGEISLADRDKLARKLNQIPQDSRFPVQWLRCELLVALKMPGAVDQVALQLKQAQSQEEQIQFVKTLLRAGDGWTPETRQQLLDWLIEHKRLPGGKLTKTILQNMRDDFEASLTESEKTAFTEKLALMKQAPEETDQYPVPVRPFVKNWTIDELDQELTRLKDQPYSAERGRRLLASALCLRCHQFNESGGQVGPDISTVGKRMNQRDLLESILDPSRQIDPKYHLSNYILESGKVITGRTTLVSRDVIGVETDALTGQSVSIKRAEIAESLTSPTSPMPSGLLNSFTAEEVNQLIRYLRNEVISK